MMTTMDGSTTRAARAPGLRIANPTGAAPTMAAAGATAPTSDAARNSAWLANWCAPQSIEERLELIHQLAGKRRLPSHLAAEVWLQLRERAAASVLGTDAQLLDRQFLMLAPEHAAACSTYDALMNADGAQPPGSGIVFMITSCQRYLPQAQRVLNDLRARGADACIMIGDPSLSVSVEEGPIVRLPVPDSYEALLHKVLEGLTFLRRKHGQVCVAKIDDDMRLNQRFDPKRLAAMASSMGYVGHPLGDQPPDRCWHLGKTSVPTPIFTRRHRGRFAYGPMYLLGERAVEHLVREWVFFPGEFAGELYEDRAVGDCLRRAGIDLRPVEFATMGGIVDTTERLIPASH